ncbi:antibiotic biosynthesis monooxygenase [Pseudomonas akapageensis]|uniref:antibiotic biosynthesis monooxygenase n=1 Tax=Pseudomonas akapageensis TaxID=2609961 RepID=UPI00140C71BE|nr:antibiotic biosynthesis monooxygenase [Pseudomonas akapageensis]
MIVRLWHGRTKREDAEQYEQFMRVRAAPDYGSVAGLSNVYFTRRDEGAVSHFLLITVWDSIEAVKRFAGEHPEKAKYYAEDDGFLLEKEENVDLYDVFLSV